MGWEWAGRLPQFRRLEPCAFEFLDQRVAVMNGLQPHRERLALDWHLRGQGYRDAGDVFGRPPLEAGQFVGATDGKTVAVSEGHRWFFLDMGNRRRRPALLRRFQVGS